ncbi:hypothetical protein F5883DRAFT_609885 [Diaporthe sp. PMI_573]|nr:hypothetical protein F5883DRAFT_609885 [Diaporthaceae sp. PMI_573]
MGKPIKTHLARLITLTAATYQCIAAIDSSLAWEWPLRCTRGSTIYRSIIARFLVLPMVALVAIFLYQATNAAIYYLIGLTIYIWAYFEHESIQLEPWSR